MNATVVEAALQTLVAGWANADATLRRQHAELRVEMAALRARVEHLEQAPHHRQHPMSKPSSPLPIQLLPEARSATACCINGCPHHAERARLTTCSPRCCDANCTYPPPEFIHPSPSSRNAHIAAKNSCNAHYGRHAPKQGGTLAYEITGCLRNLEGLAALKLPNVAEAARAGWTVDVFCVLELCDSKTQRHAQSGEVKAKLDAFGRTLKQGGARTVDCTTVMERSSDNASRSLVPDSTYRSLAACRHPHTDIDHTLLMFDKFARAHALRVSSGVSYDVVWRTRTDRVSDWNGTLGAELACMLAEPARWYLVPHNLQGEGFPTDSEAILPVGNGAANWYASVLNGLAVRYATEGARPRYFFHPETDLADHMRSGGFAYVARPQFELGWRSRSPATSPN
jgi:hypothetical protein